jgi:hypothetical protein
VSLPGQGPGLCHVALLPGPKPNTTDSSNTSAEENSTAAAPDAPAAAPLLLLPLLVLPEEAAAEMQQGWQAAAAAGKSAVAAAAATAAGNASTDVSAAIAEMWAGIVSSLTVDIAYVLSACSAASVAAGDTAKGATPSSNSANTAEQAMPLPAGVFAVLANVLQHLAARGVFQTMKFLVDAATASTAATAAVNTNSDTDSSCDAVASSNKSCSSCSEVEPLHEQPPAADAAAAAAEPPKLSKPVKHQMDPTDVYYTDSCTPRALPAAAAPAYSASSTSPSLLQLLCGFADPLLESRFMAATFRSSTTLDLFSAVYNVSMGIGCWFAAGGKLHSLTSPHNEQQQHHAGTASFGTYQAAAAAAAWLDGWSIRLVWSVVVVALLHLGASLGVAVLRVRTYLKLQRLHKQQQQRQKVDAMNASCSSAAEQQDEATGGNAEQAAAAAAAAVYREAGFARQRLLAWCVVQISLLNVLCATGGVIAPIMIVRAWGLHS